MTIKEVEQQTGLPRANIRFYEQMGLLCPKRSANGYRTYTPEEISVLQKIHLLRSLHLSLDEIRLLKDGEESLADALTRQMDALKQEQKQNAAAQDVCLTMRSDHATFGNLDAEKYLRQLSGHAEKTPTQPPYLPQDEDIPAPQPWRRFFARLLDLALADAVISLGVLGILFRIHPARLVGFAGFFSSCAAFFLMLFAEPVCLRLFGTTPGKALMGLHIEGASGEHPALSEGFLRTFGVIRRGCGFGLPGWNLYCMWKSFRLCRDRRILPWEEETDTSCAPSSGAVGIFRTVAYLAVCTVLFVCLVLTLLYQQLAPNRAPLTITDFTENFRYFADYNGFDFDKEGFDTDGTWKELRENGADGAYTVYVAEHVLPEFTWEEYDGKLTGVRFTVTVTQPESFVETYSSFQYLTALSMLQAQPETGLFSRGKKALAEAVSAFEQNPQNYELEQNGLLISCRVTYSGLACSGSGFLYPTGEKDAAFHLDFSVRTITSNP